MNRFLTSNEWQWRLLRTVVQGVLGVVVANVDLLMGVAEGDTAWHAGNWLMNCRSVGIEVVSAGEDNSEVEVGKLAWLVQTLMKRYDISEGGVIRHYDVTGKICPAPYIAAGC